MDEKELPPLSIDDITALFDDLALEVYFGANFKAVMMSTDDDFMYQLRDFVDRVKREREALG